MSNDLLLASYAVFDVAPEGPGAPTRDVVAKEIRSLLDEWSDRVETRGVYSTTAFHPTARIMFWWVSRSVDDIQALHVALARTSLGPRLEQREAFLGLVRPAEFAKDHLPAFAKGEPPKKYISVYPFVRTSEWYLLEPEERGRLLREHGEAGREFPDVLANTTSAFGLGDFEWILCFEADSPDRIVELIRRLRATEARRFTKVEIPFVAGIRKDIEEVLADVP